VKTSTIIFVFAVTADICLIATSCSKAPNFSFNGDTNASSYNKSPASEELSDSKKPTDDSEGLPGYLVDPKGISSKELENGKIQIRVSSKALETTSGINKPVIVQAHIATKSDLNNASLETKDTSIKAKQVFDGVSQQSEPLVFQVGIPENSKLMVSFAAQQESSIKILKAFNGKAAMAVLEATDDAYLTPIVAEQFFSADATEAEIQSAPTCSGVEIAGACWYKGDPGESCTDVCQDHGGYNDATLNFAGSNGTLDQCKEVLAGLSMQYLTTSTLVGTGTGCSMLALVALLSPGPTTADAKAQLYSRACACNE
jgi:hypothetical protein